MRDNNRNAHLTQKAMFGERPVIIQNDEPSSIVNKIVEVDILNFNYFLPFSGDDERSGID